MRTFMSCTTICKSSEDLGDKSDKLDSAPKSKARACDSSCNHCQTEFRCGKLQTALTIIEAKLAQVNLKFEDVVNLSTILAKLKRGDWSYPESSNPCVFSETPEEIEKITYRLIDVLSNGVKVTKAS